MIEPRTRSVALVGLKAQLCAATSCTLGCLIWEVTRSRAEPRKPKGGLPDYERGARPKQSLCNEKTMNGSQLSSSEDDEMKKYSGTDDGSSRDKDKPAQDNVHLKVLIPSVAAGAIIGRGGEAIGLLQKESGAKVKMSKANDFYPGTTERVCLIVATVNGIERVHDYIMERIAEKPDANSKPIEITLPDGTKQLIERGKQVKVLVPNSTAGMIIGKGGSYIKELKDRTGSFIQISQKGKEVNLTERCITIAGELDQNRQTVHLILQKIAEDPQSASCPNISYSDVHGPVASAHPTGSPYACPLSPGSSSHSQQHSAGASHAHASSSHSGPMLTPSTTAMLTPPTPGAGHGPPPLNPAGGHTYQQQTSSGWAIQQAVVSGLEQPSGPGSGLLTPGITQGTVDQLAAMLRQSGYSDPATEEILQAMCTLANYGFLNLTTLNMNVGLVPNPAGRQGPPQLGLPAQLTSLALPMQSNAGHGGASNVNVPSVSPLSITSPSSSFNLGASGIGFMQQSMASNSSELQSVTPSGQDHSSGIERPLEDAMYQTASGASSQQTMGAPNTHGGFMMGQTAGVPSQPHYVNQYVVGGPQGPNSGTFSATANAFSPQASMSNTFSPQAFSPHSAASFAPSNTATNGAQSASAAQAQASQSAAMLDPLAIAAFTGQSGLLQPDYTTLFTGSDVGLSALSLSLGGVAPTGSPLLSPTTTLLIASAAQPDRNVTHELSVSESLVGVILGVGGRQITEIQAQTGTNIQVSKKGVFYPGSKNRVVTISGPSPNVQRAAMIIQSRIHTEDTRRGREARTSGSTQGRTRQTSGGWEKGSGPGTVTPTPSDLLTSPNEANDGSGMNPPDSSNAIDK